MATANKTAAKGPQAKGGAARQAQAPAPTAGEQPAAETATYVVGHCPVLHDGKTYLPGFDIELTDAQAERLGALVSLAPTQPEPPLE